MKCNYGQFNDVMIEPIQNFHFGYDLQISFHVHRRIILNLIFSQAELMTGMYPNSKLVFNRG